MIASKIKTEKQPPFTETEIELMSPLDERLEMLKRKVDFFVKRVGESHSGLIELRKEIETAFTAEDAVKKEILEKGKKMLACPEFEIEIENSAADPLLVEKVDASDAVFKELKKNPQTDLTKLEAKKIVQNPKLLAAIVENPEIWEKIKKEGALGIIVADALKDPKKWSEKIGETGESISEFVKRNPELTAAAAVGLTLAGILMLFGKGKIKKAFGAISLGVAGFLGFKKWGEAVGYLVEAGLKNLGVSKKTIEEWKSKKETFEKEVTEKIETAKEKGSEIKKAAAEKVEELEKSAATANEVAREKGEQIFESIPASEATKEEIKNYGQNPSVEKGRRVLDSCVQNEGPVVVKGVTAYLVNHLGDLVDLEKWIGLQYIHSIGEIAAAPQKNSDATLGNAIVQYFAEAPKFCLIFWSSDRVLNFFRKVPVGHLRSLGKGLGWIGTVPFKIFQAGKVVKGGIASYKAGKWSFNYAKKAIEASAKSPLAKKAAKKTIKGAEKVSKKSLDILKKKILARCSNKTTKKFFEAALKKIGARRLKSFLAKRGAAIVGTAATGAGAIVSIGLTAWTFYDLGKMGVEIYQDYDTGKEITARGQLPIKKLTFDEVTQKALEAEIPTEGIKSVDEMRMLETFDKIPTATLFIEREGENNREKWIFKNGEIVDIQIEKI